MFSEAPFRICFPLHMRGEGWGAFLVLPYLQSALRDLSVGLEGTELYSTQLKGSTNWNQTPMLGTLGF